MSIVTSCEYCGEPFAEDPEGGEVFVECEYCGDFFCADDCLIGHEEEEHQEEIDEDSKIEGG